MSRQSITPGSAPIVWSTVEDAFTKINANFTELYASIGDTGSIVFDALESDLIPFGNDVYDLGSPNKRWASLYLSNTLMIGGAAITNEGLTINLPSGTRVGGDLIIDPNKAFFKEFSVNSNTSVVADQFNDVLDFNAGTGIQLTVTSTNDQINITNTGVTSLVAGTAMSVSAATGAVTINNTGVTAITAGLGMSRNTATGAVTIVNEGIIDVDAGVGISVGARDPVSGKVIVTNTLPAGNAYRIFATAGEPNLTARSTADTLTLIEGAGINITNTVASGALTNRITLENTGVLSLTAGAGITVSAATGAVTVSFNNRTDIIGSVFADDSTMLIDGVNGYIYGNVSATTLRTSETKIALGINTGSVSQGASAVAIGDNAGQTSQGAATVAIGILAGRTSQGNYAVAIGAAAGSTNQGDSAVAIGDGAGFIGQPANSIIINASGAPLNGSAAGFFVDPIRNQTSTGNVLTYNTTTKEIVYSTGFAGDVTGSVFSDNSTRLIDGTEGKIVGPVDSSTVTASSYIQTAVYVDLTAIAAALPTPAKGMIVFDDGTNQFRGYDGSSWIALN
jgi:hypothetical protein